jgi:hypothetical protein
MLVPFYCIALTIAGIQFQKKFLVNFPCSVLYILRKAAKLIGFDYLQGLLAVNNFAYNKRLTYCFYKLEFNTKNREF